MGKDPKYKNFVPPVLKKAIKRLKRHVLYALFLDVESGENKTKEKNIYLLPFEACRVILGSNNIVIFSSL